MGNKATSHSTNTAARTTARTAARTELAQLRTATRASARTATAQRTPHTCWQNHSHSRARLLALPEQLLAHRPAWVNPFHASGMHTEHTRRLSEMCAVCAGGRRDCAVHGHEVFWSCRIMLEIVRV